MTLSLFLIGFLLGVFMQENIIPILNILFQLLYLKVESKKSELIYDISLNNKESEEINSKVRKSNPVGFRTTGDENA